VADDLLKQYPKLRGFAQHGVAWQEGVSGSDQAHGECPFCGHEKFYTNVETRAWDCKFCGRSGGWADFLATRIQQCQANMRGTPVVALGKDRGLRCDTIRRWGVAFDGTHYLVPVAALGPCIDLRRFRLGRRVVSTSGGRAGMMAPEGALERETVWLCEGWADGAALDEVLTLLELREGVAALPGANSFPQPQAAALQGKHVIVAYDNDDAGRRGAARVEDILLGTARSIRHVHWPKGKPEGYDVRDLYADRGGPGAMYRALRAMVRDEAPPTGKDAPAGVSAHQRPQAPSGVGLPRDEVIDAYRKWLHVPAGGVEAIDVLFGTFLANRLDGDPLWLFLVAPPGASKSSYLMTFQDAPLIMTTTSLTPHALISGMAQPGGADPSLIPRLDGKVLVIKDFTTILTMHYNARDEIFGILRDAYDGRTEKFFGNGIFRVYESSFGIVAGVTPAIEAYGNTSLGERFLKYRIRYEYGIGTGEELIRRALRNVTGETKMRDDLRAIAAKALDRDVGEAPSIPPDMEDKFLGLAQWVAAMRGTVTKERYTREVQFKPEPEVGTRLAKQLAKLAMGVALFRGEDEIGPEAYLAAAHAARDTIPGRVEEVVRQLWTKRQEGWAETTKVAAWSYLPVETVRTVLQDLNMLRIVDLGSAERNAHKWRLSKRMRALMAPLGIYKAAGRRKKT